MSFIVLAKPFIGSDVPFVDSMRAVRHKHAATFVAALVCLSVSAALPADASVDDGVAPSELAARVEALRGAASASILERERRILVIGEKLRTSGVELCPEQRRLVWGVVTATERERVSRGLAPWKRKRNAGRDVEIVCLEPGSPADRAGLAVGDVIVSLDGRRLKTSTDLYRPLRGKVSDSLSLSVRRHDEKLEISMPVVLGCFTAAGLRLSDEVNGYQTYHGICVTAGMLRFATNDDELALVLGHEIGHAILETGNKPYYEADADYIGLYLAARAGYDIAAAPRFWRRRAIQNPDDLIDSRNIGFRSHPLSTSRALSLEATIREIREKRAAGLPLEPEVPH